MTTTKHASGRSRGLPRVAALLTLAATLIGAFVGIAGLFHWFSSPDSGALRVETSDSAVSNGADMYESVGTKRGSADQQTRDSTPTIHVVVLNTGAGTALITRVAVELEAYASVDECVSQGAGEVPQADPYALQLPTLPLTPASRLVVDNSPREIRSQAALTLTVRLSVANYPAALELYQLFRLKVHLFTDNPAGELTTGPFVVSEPGAVPADGTFLPQDDSAISLIAQQPKPARIAAAWCFMRNLRGVSEVVGRGATESSQVAALSAAATARGWSLLRGQTSPSADALELLQSAVVSADSAVFAARESGSAKLLARVRKAAAADLLADAERGIKSTPANLAVPELEIRDANRIDLQPAGTQLLEQLSRAPS